MWLSGCVGDGEAIGPAIEESSARSSTYAMHQDSSRTPECTTGTRGGKWRSALLLVHSRLEGSKGEGGEGRAMVRSADRDRDFKQGQTCGQKCNTLVQEWREASRGKMLSH